MGHFSVLFLESVLFEGILQDVLVAGDNAGLDDSYIINTTPGIGMSECVMSVYSVADNRPP